MRNLNVFKLARNADFNVKGTSGSHNSSASVSGSVSSSSNNSNSSFASKTSTKSFEFPSPEYEYITENETTDAEGEADGSDSGWNTPAASSTGTGKSKKSSRSKYTYTSHPSQAKYIPVDPDSMMTSPVRTITSSQSSIANIMSTRNVHVGLDNQNQNNRNPNSPGGSNANANANANVSVHYNGDFNGNRDAVENMNERAGPVPVGIRAHQNGNGNAIHEVDPELYKRLINEAPFLMTAKEPPLQQPPSVTLQTSPSMDVTDGGGDSPSSETGTMSSNSITIAIGSGSLSSTSRSVSVTQTDSSVSMYDIDLDWVDPKLIKQGRNYIRRNFLNLMFAHFIGLALLLAVRPVASILLRNSSGKFHKPAKRHNWHLYLLLIRRLKSWYDKGDLTDLDDPTTVDVLKLRKQIWKASKNFRKFLPPPAQDLELSPEEGLLLEATRNDLNDDTGLLKEVSIDMKNIPKIFATRNPDIPWSQYDIAVTQFAFFGFISLFPRTFGIHSSKGLKGFIHIWAVLGHLLGLENQFNLCHPNNFDEETNKKIFKHVFLFSFKIGDNGMFHMLKLLASGITWFTIFMSRLKLVLLFMTREVAQVHSTKNLYGQVKWYDRLEYFIYRFWLRWLGRIFFLRMLANLLARFVLQVAYGVYFAQIQWKHWRARRKTPQPVIYPSSISLTVSSKA